MLLTFFVFFSLLILLGLSFSLRLKFVSRAEQVVLTLAFGLGVFPLLTVVMNWLYVPLHVFSYLIIGLLASFLSWKIVKKQKKFEVEEWRPVFVVIGLGILVTGIFVYGAFRYAYLEDDDPWRHALGTAYVAEHKTYSVEFVPELWFRTYLEPYPPAFDVLMAVLFQTHDSMQETLKVFNAVFVGLGHVFFFFLARQLLGSAWLGVLASGLLVLMPSFASHFIWAQSLSVALMFPALLSLLREGREWRITSVVLFAGLFLTQLSSAIAVAGLGGLLAITKRDWKGIVCVGLGVVVAIGVFYLPMLGKYGWHTTKQGNGLYDQTLTGNTEAETSGGKVYGWSDFVKVPKVTRIDQPTGLGWPLVVLSLAGLVLSLWRRSRLSQFWLVLVLWFVFTLAGIEGNLFPVKLFPHRFWLFFSVPAALLSVLVVKAVPKNVRTVAVIGILISVLLPAGMTKLFVQTLPWQPGESWVSKNELQGYLQLKNALPKNTPILTLCTDRDEVIGLDFKSLPLDKDLLRLRKDFKQLTVERIVDFMKNKKFEYLILDNHCIKQHGRESAEKLFNTVVSSGRFSIKHQTSGMFLFEIIHD